MIAIFILIVMILEHLKSGIQKIPEVAEKTAQAVKSMISKISHNSHVQNVRKTYKTAALAVTLVTNMTNCTICGDQHQAVYRNTHNIPGTQKLNDEYNGSFQLYTSRTLNDNHD